MTDRELLNLARSAAESAYAPYSRFKVGAALECAGGRVFTGCNVENSALGSTMCAERVALFKAISEGERHFSRIAIYGESEDYCMPCGACRQVLSEFSQDMEVLCAKASGGYVSYKLRSLLPHAFRLGSY
ncbi:MAG: cytidine deaminase [Oscillospiraceae bacterium]|jgi:cytidine deaminase|nr:cytidine deaminase [Oscillospiraceae bacterium]